MTRVVDFRNVLVLLGIVVSTAAIIYFATEFFDVLSDWGRVASLALLAVVFLALGMHFEREGDATEVVSRSGWRWLRVTNALYILGAIATFGTVLAFFAVDQLDRVWKVLITLGLGLGLIVFAARRFERRPAQQEN